MGIYINPPELVKQQGRRVVGDNYEAIVKQLEPGEALAAYVDRGPFKQAPVLPDAYEFEEFHIQYRRGQVLRCDFYAVPEALAE